MEPSRRKADLPPIPAKRYFTIGEVSDLCGVKPHVLRYWEQEFTQLKPVKRRGNRRYYQHHAGFPISGARNRLDNARLDNGRIDNGAEPEEKIDPPVAARSGASGVDLTAIKRELKAVLEQLRG